MLYTSRPLERIYADPEVFDSMRKDKLKEEDKQEFKELILPNGRIITRRSGEDYVVHKVYSTDMSDYLKEEYSPGKSIK